MEFSSDEIHAFRFWIQGYPNFYEPIVEEYFRVAGYRVVRRPALVGRADIQRVVDALFDGHKQLGPELDEKAIRRHLERRQRLQPDLLLERGGQRHLAEFKSWGGSRSGQFDLNTAQAGLIRDHRKSAFLLVDHLDGFPIAGKILVVSSRSPDHDRVLDLLCRAYRTGIELLYLDEIFATPQLRGFIDRQLHYLDAAVAELRQALLGGEMR
jgi:hypothetical protein